MRFVRILSALTLLPLAAGAQLTLQQAVGEALGQSDQSRILDEKLVRSREFENEQRGALWPSISAYTTAGRGAQPTPMGNAIFNEPSNLYTYGVQAQGPIFTFGKLSTAIKMAELQDKAIKSDVQGGKQKLQLEVIDAFVIATVAARKVEVLKASQVRQAEVYAATERDFTSGKGMKAEVLMSRSRLSSLVPEIAAAERDADGARRNLNRLLGRQASDTAALDTTAAFPSVEGNLPATDEALQRAYNNRPDLKAVQTSAEVYEGTSTIFKANYLPSIFYQGKLGIMAYETDQLFDWENNQNWQIGVAMNWTLFDGFGPDAANAAVAAQWRSDARVFQYRANELRRVVEMEVEAAMRDCRTSDSSLASAQLARDAAAEALTLYRSMYQGGGMVRLSDILQSEETLQAAELGLLSARFARTRALARLNIVQGLDLVTTTENK